MIENSKKEEVESSEEVAEKDENVSDNQKIIDLLEANLDLNEKMYKMMLKVDSFVFWQNLLGWGKVLIVVVPLIVAVIFLPPLVKNLVNQYKEALGLGDMAIPGVSSLLKDGKDAKVDTSSFASSDLYKKEFKLYNCSKADSPWQGCFCDCLENAKDSKEYQKCVDSNKCDAIN